MLSSILSDPKNSTLFSPSVDKLDESQALGSAFQRVFQELVKQCQFATGSETKLASPSSHTLWRIRAAVWYTLSVGSISAPSVEASHT